MIGIDTNVLVRYLAQDDARQSAQANSVMESFTARSPGFISILTLAETAWVMRDIYARSRTEIAALIEAILNSEGLVVQMTELVWRSLHDFESGRADLTDHLIERLGAAAGCECTYSFNKSAIRDAGMRPVPATAS